jgi:hypothetical protein
MSDATHCCARDGFILFLSLATLPLQLGSVMSRSTANVASYSMANGVQVSDVGQNQMITIFEPRHIQRLLSQPANAKWMRTSDKQYFHNAVALYLLPLSVPTKRNEGNNERTNPWRT